MVTLTAGLVFGHECFNASRSARANTVIGQHSHGWFDIHTSQLIAILIVSCVQQPSGDCPPPPPLSAADFAALKAGDFEKLVGEILGFVPPESAVTDLLAFTTRVENEAACLGVPKHYLTLSNATAAGGADKNAGQVVANGKGIEHFPEVYGQQIFTAYATVLSGTPSACR
jgi:hypothetical protein